MKHLFRMGLLSLGLMGAMSHQQIQAQELNEILTIDPKVTTGVLPNGLRYYIRPNQKPENKVELRLAINTGSLMEDDDQQGLAHFLEHMNFNGTKNFPKNELVDYLQTIGVEFGADLNAYTSFDETVYILPIPTDQKGNVEKGFQILGDWAQGALLTTDDINDERKIILEESRLGKGAQDRMAKKFLPELLAGSRYANRLPIGKDELISSFPADVLRRYHKDWYRPNLMSVAVVGDITTEKAMELIQKNFAGLTNPKNIKERKPYGIDPYKTAKAMFLTDKEQPSTIFLMNFSAEKDAADKTVADYKNTLVRNLALTLLNQRYQDLSQSATPPFIFAQSGFDSYVRNHGAFNLALMPANNDLSAGINAAIGELLSVNKFGFNNSELELAKRDMLSSMEKSYNERNNTQSSRLVEEYVRNFLEDEPIPGIEVEYNIYKKYLPTIGLSEVNAAMKSMFDANDIKSYFALVMSPENTEDKINSDASLLNAVNASLAQVPTEKEEIVVQENILDQMPVAGSIVNKTIDEKLGATTYTLSNGVKVTVKPTDFKSDEVLVSAVKHGGMSNYGANDVIYGALLSDVIESMGYGNYTPTELSKVLSGTNISLVPSFDETNSGLNGSSDVKNLDKLMQLIYLQMTQPRSDKELLNSFTSKMKSQLMFIKANPQVAFIDTLYKSAYNNNPLRPIVFPTADQLNSITAERALEIYKNEFTNADGYHFFIVGNVDEKTLTPLMNQYLASLPVKGTTPKFRDNGLRMKPGNNKFVYEKGKDEKSLIIGMYHGEMPYSEDMALKANLLGDILTIRVIENIREKMAAIYSGNFMGTFERDPYPMYTFMMQLPTNPESVEPVLKAVNDEIASLKKDGPLAKDLEKAKIALVEKRKESMKKNEYWLSKLKQLQFDGYSTERFFNWENELNKISVNDMKKAANLFFDGKNSFIGVLNPEAKTDK